MPRKRRFSRDHRGSRAASGRLPYFRRSCAEVLEDRRLLTGYFDNVAARVDTGLAGITGALNGISSVAKLPLINVKLEEIDQLTDSLDTFRLLPRPGDHFTQNSD